MKTARDARQRGYKASARRWAFVALAALLASAACTALLDQSATQCQTDSDCQHFGGHPYCQSGLCVASGLGPSNCFYGAPQQASDFLNQCTTAQCQPFDNCARVGVCGDASDMDGPLDPPPPADPPAEASSAPEAEASGAPSESEQAVAGDGGDAGNDSGDGGDGGDSGDDGGDGGDGGDIAEAGPLASCVDPTNGRSHVVFLTGSSNFPPLLSKLAPLVIDAGYTPVYQVTNSCTGVASVLGSSHVINDPAPGSSGNPAEYFELDGGSVPCALGPTGATVDVGESDIYSSSCKGYGAPTPGVVQEYLGPIQAMTFVVPSVSGQDSISAQVARVVFGSGGAGDAGAPWTDPTLYFVRNQNTGTQQMIGKAINVPPGQFWGIDRGSASNVDMDLRVLSGPIADKAIGIISSDYYDTDRDNLKALAFQAAGQGCAFLPDSTPHLMDKQNVRDGHYPIWGPIHFFAALTNGAPASQGAAAFVNLVSVPTVPQVLLDAFIHSSLVPECAMQVQRSTELGPMSAYTPPTGCSCYFEASVGAAAEGCKHCSTPNDCTDPSRPVCNYGFCDTQSQ